MSVLLLLYLCRPDISLHHNKFFLDCLQIMWTIQPANTLNRAYHNLCQFSSNISSHLDEDRNSHRKNALQKVPLFDWSVWLGQEKNVFFLGCGCTFMSHVEFLVNQHRQVPLLNQFLAQSLFVLGIVLRCWTSTWPCWWKDSRGLILSVTTNEKKVVGNPVFPCLLLPGPPFHLVI